MYGVLLSKEEDDIVDKEEGDKLVVSKGIGFLRDYL